MTDGWRVGTLGEAALVNPTDPPLPTDAPFVPMDAVTPGSRWPTYFTPREERSGARARAGDTLFARITPCLENGKVAQVPTDIDRCGGSTEFIVLRAGPEILPEYVYVWATAASTRLAAQVLMTGTTGRQRLSAQDMAALPMAVPSIVEQRRIVSVVRYADEVLFSAESATRRANELVHALREGSFERLWASAELRPLGELVRRVRRPIEVVGDATYFEIGVRSHGRGIFHKEPVRGTDLGSKRVFGIDSGDLVLNIVFAWERAAAVARQEDAGRCGSHRFPTYRPRSGVDIDYVCQALLSDRGAVILGLASPGSAGRNRTLNQESLLRSLIPVPGLAEQRRLVAVLAAARDIAQANERYRKAAGRLRMSVLDDLLSGRHNVPETYDRLLDGAA